MKERLASNSLSAAALEPVNRFAALAELNAVR